MRMFISRSSSASSQFSKRFVFYYHYKLLAFFRLTSFDAIWYIRRHIMVFNNVRVYM
jgi:hypothetical protein